VKKVFIILLFLAKWAQAQPTYFQQQVNYQLQVQLNDVQHRLTGFETIQYTNHSPDTLTYIWFHLWPNAYKNDRTAFSEQLLTNNRIDFYFSPDSAKGYISQLNFTVNGNKALLEPSINHIDIAKLVLPQPLLPNQTITIATPFEVQLPHNFSRGGHIGQFYQITQWYPKPAVYDNKGWHTMPYVDQGEFYSEFGSYDVQITLPSNYLVAASGRLQNAALLQNLKQLGKQPIAQQPNALWHQVQINQPRTPKGKRPAIKPRGPIVPTSAATQQTWHFTIDSAHDVAWFASKQFVVQYDTVPNTNQTTTDVFTFFHPWQAKQWSNAVQFAKNALSFYSRQLGPYPYHTASVVAGNEAIGSGGMEYPGITLITTQSDGRELDATIAHELGHNWFYGALASNERNHAWMDESMNTFYQEKYEQEQYLTQSINQPSNAHKSFEERKGLDQLDATLVATLEKMHKAQPINLASTAYTDANYGLMVYTKGSQWMQRLEQYLGKPQFEKCMQQYYQQWRFKHPYPLDFKKSIEHTSGKSIDSLYSLLATTTSLTPKSAHTQWKLTGFFSLYETNRYKYISVMPMVATNANDKLMLGMLVHNYQLPLPNWQFIAAPLWATGSKQLNGFARVAYQKFQPGSSLLVSGSVIKYNYSSFAPNDAPKLYLGVTRWVPSVKYTWYNQDLRNKAKCELLVRSILLKETELRFSTINISPTETKQLVTTEPTHSYINQLAFTWSNSRKLYPYSLQVGIDQGSKFLRAGITGNYFFNYPSQIGGIEARFFAGKFVYLAPQTYITQSQTYRYHLQLSAPNGASDYTYSQYFIGRGDFEGWRSKQVMQRDGFFKVNTQQNADQVGRTDNWLMALNISGNIPNQYNPLSVLPIKLPLKFFVDAGTYAEAWQANAASGRFLYDAGLQVSLLQNLVNIYFPLVSSKVFTDYQKSVLGKNRFWKTVSFSIDIQRLKPSYFSKYIPL